MRLQPLLPLLVLGHHAAQGAAASSAELSLQDMQNVVAAASVNDIWNKLKNASGCAGCEGVLGLVKALAFLGDSAFVKVAQQLCKLSKSVDEDVCDGAIALEGPIIADDLRKMHIGSRTSRAFCTTILGLCGYPDVPPWQVPFPSPKPQGSSRPRPSGKTPLKVVHYSDIHVDPLYVTGSSTECSKPICCRPYTDSDRPGESKSPAGPNGDHKCDVPISLEQSMYAAINEIVPDPALTIFTGDIVDHAIWNTSKPYNEYSIERAYASMNESLRLVYGTAGNHEAHPVNGFQPNSIGHETQWVYHLLSSEWSHWIDKAAADNAARVGAYSTRYPRGNLRIISLNTNLYYRHNFWVYQNMDDKDPNLQIAWLVRELDAAERAGENVYIIGHMPLGDKDTLRDGSNYLDQVFNRYSATIAAMFFGHTHVDHFEVSYANYEDRTAANAFMTSYIAPSLTPTAGMPSFRIYDVDPETFGVLDATTYIADMSSPSFQTSGPVWTKLYSAKEAYGKTLTPPVTDAGAELTPAFWHEVTAAMEANDDLFDAYIARKSREWNVASCKGQCKTDEICQLRAGRSEDNCFKPKVGFHIDKRDTITNEHGEHDECGTPISLTAFGAVTESKQNLQKLFDLIQEEIDESHKASSV